MKTFQVTISGVAPGLLQHRFSNPEDLDNKTSKQTVDHGTKEEQAEAVCYRMGADDISPDAAKQALSAVTKQAFRDKKKGNLYQPAEHMIQCLVKASVNFQVKGQGKKTYKDAVKGNITVEPECIPHLMDNGDLRYDYLIDSRPVRIGKARVMRHRPWLPEWRLAFTVNVLDEKLIPGEVLNSIIVTAGQTVGIGDYRPRFGRFIVEEFKAANKD